MSTETSALQCLQQAIAQIQHTLGTRTWFCIHELRGDDQQQHQTLNLRHHLGLSSTQYDVLLHEIGYNIGKKGMRQLLMSKTRTSEVKRDLESAIKSTLKLHRQLGMPITPKMRITHSISFVLSRFLCSTQ
jgi:hypothetical protein